MGNQGIIGDNPAGIPRKIGYNFKFHLGQMYTLPVNSHKALVKINDKPFCFIGLIKRGSSGTAAVAHGRADSRQQFIGSKGLGNVIIRSQIQGHHFFLFLGSGRYDYNGDGGIRTHLPDHFHAVDIRQPQIQ